MLRRSGVGAAVLLAVLAVVLALVFLAAGVVVAAPSENATLSLSPSRGAARSTTTIGGSITTICGREPLSASWGEVSGLRLRVPDVGPGRYGVTVGCLVGDDAAPQPRSAEATFEVLDADADEEEPASTVRLSRTIASPGADLVATGEGFAPGCPRTKTSVSIEGARTAVSATDATRNGVIEATFTVPGSAAPGRRTVVLTCSGTAASTTLSISGPGGTAPPNLSDPDPPDLSTTWPGPVEDFVVGPLRRQYQAADPPEPRNDRTQFARSIPLPSQVPWTLTSVLISVAGFAFLFWAVGFPSEPFNKTLEENRKQLHEWFSSRPYLPAAWPSGWGTFAVYAVGWAVLLSLVEEGAGANRETLTLGLGFFVAVVLTTVVYAVPAEMVARSVSGVDPARLRFMPGALVFAVGCVALSRWADFQPGYVYGLFAFYAPVASEIRDRLAARGIFIGSVSLLVLSIAAWLVWAPIATAASVPGASSSLLVLDTALAATFCLGVQTLVFGLVPVSFLDGKKLKDRSFAAWAVVWGGALLLLLHVLFVKFVVELDSPAAALKASVLFLGFFAFSAAFWLVFKARALPSPARVGAVVVVLLAATPAAVAIAFSGGDDALRATVTENARVRDGPSTRTDRTGRLTSRTTVTVDCTTDAGEGQFHRLADPYPGDFVAAGLLHIPDGRRPATC